MFIYGKGILEVGDLNLLQWVLNGNQVLSTLMQK